MPYIAGSRIYSPSDLTEFMESEFASWMSRLELDHPDRIPAAESPKEQRFESIADILRRHGEEHEAAVLAALEEQGREIVTIPNGPEGHDRTLDAMRQGPYALWHHEHHFRGVGGGTEARDIIHYALPLDPISRPAHGLLVAPQLRDMMAYRAKQLGEIYPSPPAIAAQ